MKQAIILLSIVTAALGVTTYISIVGQQQGTFYVDPQSPRVQLELWNFGVSIDPAGKRYTLNFTKTLSSSSVQLYKALITNEVLTSVVIESYTRSNDLIEKITLASGAVSSLQQSFTADIAIEQVALTFARITVQNNKYTATDTLSETR
jgi:type VI protein secretion system component Hcp